MNYLLEFTICSAVFYGLYLLIFSRLTFIRLNRIYLLSSLVISLCVPLISYQWEETVLINEPIAETSVNDISTPLLLAKNLSQLTENPITEKPFDWMMLLQILYISGIIFMFGKLSFFIIKILKISRLQNTKSYISTKGIFANSSFFNLIFIDDSTLSEPEIEQIMAHERWHIRLYHSYDLLFVEILKIVFWFNPILWFLQKSLSQVHEYEADTRMVQAYHPQTYATLLLKLANTTQRFSPIHQFSRKPLTDRIHFLFTKQKSTPMKRLAYLSILPILGVIFMAFSVEKVVKYKEIKEGSKYFKIVRENNDLYEFGNVNATAYNKVSPTLYLYQGKIAFTTGPSEISEAMILDASKYFKNYGYTLSVLSTQFDAKKKNLEKIEISLVDDKKEEEKRFKKGKTGYPPNNKSFNFDLKKMRRKSARNIEGAITIMANRDSGVHFVAPLSPPPPPPEPNKAKIRIINATGLIIDSESLLPVNEVGLYNSENKLLGKTDATGFFNIGFNVVKEGEIRFKLLAKKDGYDNFVQNEHWGDLQGNLDATYYFGLKKKTNDSKPFSKLVIDKKYASYDEVKDGLSAIKEELNFDKRVENAKKNNDQFFFKIDNDFYLINNSGWIKLNSENDKIIVNNDKIYSVKEINLYVKRSCVTGMSPITSKNASFEVQDKCLPSKLPVKVGMKKQDRKDRVGELMIDNKFYFYSIHKKDTTLYNRFGVKVNREGKPLTLPAPIKGKTKLSMNNIESINLLTSIFNSGKMKIPANMTEIKNQIYIENESTKNSDYKGFLDFINHDSYFSKKYVKSMIPENWNNVKNMKKPVIYISYDQALEFCEWKTETFTYQFMNKKMVDYATILQENNKCGKRLKFRLPTEEEWKIMVKKGLDEPKNGIGFSCVLDLT